MVADGLEFIELAASDPVPLDGFLKPHRIQRRR
jgi:hypothetical protein